MIHHLLLGLLVYIKISVSASDLLPILPHIEIGEKTYYVETFFSANWHRASQFCRYHGMHLASIKTPEEQIKLAEELKNIDNTTWMSYWTSGNDLAQSMSFVWSSDGEDFSFTNWYDNEPNNDDWGGNETEHCVEINNNGKDHEFKWNDARCSTDRFFICESYKIK